MSQHWPVTLRSEDLILRPLRMRDRKSWIRVRAENKDWLNSWEATLPQVPGEDSSQKLPSLYEMVNWHRHEGRKGIVRLTQHQAAAGSLGHGGQGVHPPDGLGRAVDLRMPERHRVAVGAAEPTAAGDPGDRRAVRLRPCPGNPGREAAVGPQVGCVPLPRDTERRIGRDRRKQCLDEISFPFLQADRDRADAVGVALPDDVRRGAEMGVAGDGPFVKGVGVGR